MKSSLCLCAALVLAFVCFGNVFGQQAALNAVGKDNKFLGACPLKHTDVKAEISGFLNRVRVRQEFENNFNEKIEAVYTFPLSNTAAVDDMTMTIGTRVVKGKIMRREEARNVYETARNNGQAAALLDQERTNIFTQSVANILPNEKVTIEISYVETLKYDAGTYEFVFPTVVAPRYNPSQVADANKISPPVAPAEMRAGHDISIEVALDAGVPVESIASKSHQIETNQLSASRAVVRLKDSDNIPNKDFILRYDVSGKKINDAVLTHRDERGGFFTLILQPPDNPPAQDVTPKEIVFVLDTSGSMGGFPIDKAKEAMKLALDGLYPNDTFNLITFAGDTAILFDKPVPATKENLQKAQEFLAGRRGSGGTEMMTAIKAALEPSDAADHIRVVCFMTDGEIGNDNEVIAEVQKHKNARVFSFGIGSSVNRNLLDKIAEEGRGEAEYVSLNDDGSAAAKRFHERVRSPLLTDVEIDWNGLPVADVYPARIQDLFSAKPVVVYGRYTGAANGTIRLKGKSAGQTIVREIPVTFPGNEPAHDTLATLWARSRIDDLTKQDYTNQKPEIKDAITNLGLEFRLLTAFTSFVAVEELVTTDGGQPRRIDVPVELPEGMNRETTLGNQDNISQQQISNLPVNGRKLQNFAMLSAGAVSGTVNVTSSSTRDSFRKPAVKAVNKKSVSGSGAGNGIGGGGGGGRSDSQNSFIIDGQETTAFRTYAIGTGFIGNVVSNGVINGKALSLPQPAYPPAAKAVNANGSVNVQVVIDERGNIISATAVSGNPLLRAAAVQAARKATFTPTQLSGKPVKITGVIVYNFVNDKKSNVTTALEGFAVKLSPEEQKLRELQAKVAPAIFALISRLQDSKMQPASDEARFVTNGKAEIRVYLADKTPAAIEELKAVGFEVVLDPTTAKFVIGRISLEKLAALAELKSVQFIAPQMAAN
ncbi:MAG: TonB family protein [Pyrinomonadaceae bacterium]